jgi:hypothetical protein
MIAKSATDLFGSDYRQLLLPTPPRLLPAWPPHGLLLPLGPFAGSVPTCSIHYAGRKWRLLIRTVNYKIVNGGAYYAASGKPLTVEDPIISINWMYDLDDTLTVTAMTEVVDRTNAAKLKGPRLFEAGNARWWSDIRGYEDGRLFAYDGKLYASVTVCDLDLGPSYAGLPPPKMALLELAADYAITKVTPLLGPWNKYVQKNWMPIDKSSGSCLRWMYSCEPLLMLDYSLTDERFQPLAGGSDFAAIGDMRGGSQLICIEHDSYGPGMLCVTHEVPSGGQRSYLHRCVFTTMEGVVVARTEPFYFAKHGIEFCAGLAYDGARLVASFGSDDATVNLGVFSLARVFQLLQKAR